MEKNTLIALVSIGFISITALVLGIVGVSHGGHGCMGNRGMMPSGIPGMMTDMRPGMMKGQRNPDMMKQLSGTDVNVTAPINQ